VRVRTLARTRSFVETLHHAATTLAEAVEPAEPVEAVVLRAHRDALLAGTAEVLWHLDLLRRLNEGEGEGGGVRWATIGAHVCASPNRLLSMLLRCGAYALAGEAAQHFRLPASYHRTIRLNRWADAVAEGALRGGWSSGSGSVSLVIDFSACEERLSVFERATLCTDLAATAASSAPLAAALLAQARRLLAEEAEQQQQQQPPPADHAHAPSPPAAARAAAVRTAVRQTGQQAEAAVRRRSSDDAPGGRAPRADMCEWLAGFAPAAAEAQHALAEAADEAPGGTPGVHAAGNGSTPAPAEPDSAALLARLQKRFEAVARLDEAVSKADAGARQYLSGILRNLARVLADDPAQDPAVRRWHTTAAGLSLSRRPCLHAAVPFTYSPPTEPPAHGDCCAANLLAAVVEYVGDVGDELAGGDNSDAFHYFRLLRRPPRAALLRLLSVR
jgi:hypothetical protein